MHQPKSNPIYLPEGHNYSPSFDRNQNTNIDFGSDYNMKNVVDRKNNPVGKSAVFKPQSQF
jgi:hypothetical protein